MPYIAHEVVDKAKQRDRSDDLLREKSVQSGKNLLLDSAKNRPSSKT